MLYLAASILCNVLLLVILKSFSHFNIPVLQGIVVNYFTAGSTAFFFIHPLPPLYELSHAPWLGTSIVLGCLFISIFYLISLTAQQISISVATVANKMSVVIPVTLAFALYNDSITFSKIAGILLALLAVYFTTKSTTTTTGNAWWFPALVFIGSGIIDAAVNYAQKLQIQSPQDEALFTGTGFYMAGVNGLLCLTYLILIKKEKFIWRSIPAGILLGIPNFFSIYFILKALGTGLMESSQLYPLANIFIVLLSTASGFLLFNEKLSKLNLAGIALAVFAILLIML